MSDVQDFLGETDFEKHDAFEFGGPAAGQSIAGTIASTPRLVTLPDQMSKVRGATITKLVIDLTVQGGDTFSVWVPPKKGLAQAIAKAVGAAGEEELKKGAKLAIRRIEDAEPREKGHNGMHQFEAKYEAPVTGVAAADWDA